MQLLDGKLVSEEILKEVALDVATLKKEGIQPKLAIILVGKDAGSLSYIAQKSKACEKTGIVCEQISYDETVTHEKVIETIHELNKRSDVHGVLVQLPLPSHIYTPEVIKAVSPRKDVDGFHAYNLGKMFTSTEFEELAPCTPLGIIKLLEYYKIDVKGMDATVVGASNIVGKPLSVMLLNRNATVTNCHIHTKNLKSHTRNADLLVVAVGKPGLIKADMVKKGAIVVDVGCNIVILGSEKGDTRGGKGSDTALKRVVGDVEFEAIAKKASYITPVPGGVGPMTVA